MGRAVLKKALSVVTPEGVLFLIIAWLAGGEYLDRALAGVTPYYVHALFLAAGLLALRFRRGRVVLALLMIALAIPAALRFATAEAPGDGARTAHNAIALLLPLNLGVLAFLGERGLLTRAGLIRVTAIVAQVGVVAYLTTTDNPAIAAFLDYAIIPERLVNRTTIGQPAILASALMIAALTVLVVLRPDPIERGLLWSIPASSMAVHFAGTDDRILIYSATAALLLLVAVIESSYAMAYRDALTGLATRRAMNEALAGLQNGYTIAMVDVDHFKRCNDRYGHDVGDQVLRMVASKLARVTGGGKPFRYGGEEFAVLFPGKRVDETMPHLERLRKEIEDSGFTLRSPDRPKRKPKNSGAAKTSKPKSGERKTIRITVSIGAAEHSERNATSELVVKAADRALYRAKEAGRNRVMA